MSLLQSGDACPAFDLPTWNPESGAAEQVSLASLAGERFALVFYPKDSTPGCTTQACALRDGMAPLAKRIKVFGVSPDGVASHEKFAAKQSLNYPLISDEEKSLCEAFGVWVEKKMYGKTFMGVQRSTFLIGPDGRIEAVIEKAKPATHLQDLEALITAAEGEGQ